MISDYIRSTHAERAKKIIDEDWNGKIQYRDSDLTSEFAMICFSHNDDPLSVLDLELGYLCGPSSFACMRLVAVALRLADILDFDGKRTPEVLFSHLLVRHPVSLIEWKKHRSIEAWEINERKIAFHARCKHPAIEAAIHAFCDAIDKELSGCSNVILTINEHFAAIGRQVDFQIPFKVDRSKIETAKDLHGRELYKYKETKFSLSKSQVIDLLMGTKLYGSPEVALRELIQNSIDACLLRRAMEKSWGNSFEPEILVKYHKDGTDVYLEIEDNGIGMDQNIIDKYYSNVGSSLYKSGEFYKLKSETNANFNPTSRFGIGILSCFMVSDSVSVETRKVYGPHESGEPLNLLIEGQESIFWIKSGSRKKPGTLTKLLLRRSSDPWRNLTSKAFTKAVENVIPNPPFKIRIEAESEVLTRDQNSFKEVRASSLRDHTWDKHQNIRTIPMLFDDPDDGFVGSAIVAILQKGSMPTSDFEMNTSTVCINGSDYNLDKSMRLAGKEIQISSTTISINDEGEIDQSSMNTLLARSKSRLSLHGIEVPMSLFPDYWGPVKNQVVLNWPIPILLVIDVCGKGDLDLNSSRTQILPGDKWNQLESQLASKVLIEVRKKAAASYWKKLKEILIKQSKGEVFRTALRNLK